MFSFWIESQSELSNHTTAVAVLLLVLILTLIFTLRSLSIQRKMAEASAADGMKDLKIAEPKKKKEPKPPKAEKKPQQAKKKVGTTGDKA
jgi:hypothetical protein